MVYPDYQPVDDAATRKKFEAFWHTPLDPEQGLMPDAAIAIYGTPIWEKLSPREIERLRHSQNLSYNWEYDATRRRLMRLYENAKRDQWNATERLDWSIDVDPEQGLMPDAAIGIYATPIWEKLGPREIERLRHESITWQLCQFLHGEQGALLAR